MKKNNTYASDICFFGVLSTESGVVQYRKWSPTRQQMIFKNVPQMIPRGKTEWVEK